MGVLLAGGAAGAQPAMRVYSVDSVSGQFTVRERQGISLREAAAPRETTVMGSPAFVLAPHLATGATNGAPVTLEPALVAVSCERIKEKFLAELGLTDAWQSRIELWINPRLSPNDMPELVASRGRHSWSYQLELPKTMPPESLVRAIVGALLVEAANRHAGAQTAEIPLWLVEGISADLAANNLPTFLLQPGMEMRGERLTLEGASNIRRQLRAREPLTFQQLSWPEGLQTPEGKAFFRACSQFFVEQLLALKDGQAALRNTLLHLGQKLNWQTVFLTEFHNDFASLLAVEKWWTVTAIAFREANSGEMASSSDVWRRLQLTLDVPVEVRLASGRLPAEACITMQEAITKWDVSESQAAARRAILEMLTQRYRATPDLQPLIDQYITALSGYVEETQDLQRKGNSVRNASGQFAVAKRAACKRLDALDAERARLRVKYVTKNTR
jgi:hypothetical protein